MKLKKAAAAFGVATALTFGAAAPALAVDDPAEEATDDGGNNGLWGLLGLLGLAGLAGLRRRPAEANRGGTGTGSTTGTNR